MRFRQKQGVIENCEYLGEFEEDFRRSKLYCVFYVPRPRPRPRQSCPRPRSRVPAPAREGTAKSVLRVDRTLYCIL